MHILGISGSLQEESANTELLRIAAELAPVGIYESVANLPHFRPDIALPTEVVAFSERVSATDAVMIASPEYAFGVPGSLKNALDWLVGTGALYGKRVAVLSAAPSRERGANARADLERTLRGQGADVRASMTIARGDDARAALRKVLESIAR